MKQFKVLAIILLAFISCKVEKDSLPFLGNTIEENGNKIYHKVGNVEHYNQDSIFITSDSMHKYIIIADFFFTSCPSICPKVAKEMKIISDALTDYPDIKLASFTIDPKRDNPKKLKLYAENINANLSNWWFLTGDKDYTLSLANTFFVSALEDAEAPGGFDHSGKIVLVDKDGHVRSFSEGTDPSTTQQLIDDAILLHNMTNGK